MVMFSAGELGVGQRKDTVNNIESTGYFCWNMATYDLREAVNITAEQVPPGVNEFERAGMTAEKAQVIPGQMVKESPIKFECQYVTTIRLPGGLSERGVNVVIGRVVGIHIKDEVLTDGIVDLKKIYPIARCGYWSYAVISETFDMIIPGSAATRAGLEGNAKLYRATQEAAVSVGNGNEAQEPSFPNSKQS